MSSKTEITKIYKKKVKELKKHNKFYHTEDKPIISDSEFDQLKKEILDLEKENDFLRSVIDIGEIISRRQDLPQTFYRDGSIYITRVETVKTGTFYGETIGYIENSSDFHVNIDTETDWINAELIAKEIKK